MLLIRRARRRRPDPERRQGDPPVKAPLVLLAAALLSASVAYLPAKAFWNEGPIPGCCPPPTTRADDAKPAAPEVAKGLSYLVEHQGAQGGFGLNDGNDPDVANTAIAALAMLQAGSTPAEGPYRDALRRAIEFVLREVE